MVAARMDTVIRVVPSIDPTLEGRARSALGRMEHELETLYAKVLQAAKRRDETLRRQFTHVQAQAFPGGQPQEARVEPLEPRQELRVARVVVAAEPDREEGYSVRRGGPAGEEPAQRHLPHETASR